MARSSAIVDLDDAAQSRPPFGARLLSLLIDYALILVYLVLLALAALAVAALTGGLYDWLELGTGGAELLGFIVLVLPVGVYLYLCEASERQATVGKRALRLRVVDAATGGRLPKSRVLLRTAVKLLPWEVAHFMIWQAVGFTAAEAAGFPAWLTVGLISANVLPIVYVVMVLLQRDRRGPHDLAAGSKVIRVGAGERIAVYGPGRFPSR